MLFRSGWSAVAGPSDAAVVRSLEAVAQACARERSRSVAAVHCRNQWRWFWLENSCVRSCASSGRPDVDRAKVMPVRCVSSMLLQISTLAWTASGAEPVYAQELTGVRVCEVFSDEDATENCRRSRQWGRTLMLAERPGTRLKRLRRLARCFQSIIFSAHQTPGR